jgi:CheY-like chemotaxis protein
MDLLLVEDDPASRDALALLLRAAGHTVTTAADGQAALDSLQARTPDVILLDLMLPVVTGWEFRARQLENPDWARIPVVILSAVASFAELYDVPILHKPINLDLLLATLQQVQTSGAAAPPRPLRSGRPVLLIEESCVNHEALRWALFQERVDVECVGTEDETFAYLDAGPRPVLILVHFTSRHAALTRLVLLLRASPRAASIPIVVVAPPGTVPPAADFLLPKPVEFDDLLALLRKVTRADVAAAPLA